MTPELLDEKLDRRIPGAFVNFARAAAPDSQWQVVVHREAQKGYRVLATGASKREAIDRACFLYGSQR